MNRTTRLIVATLVCAGALSAVGASAHATGDTTPPAGGAGKRLGELTITDPNYRDKVLDHGKAATQFSIKPPDGSTCPGDSANDQWRLQSYFIPAGEDPTKIRYGSIGPDPYGSGHYALFITDTRPFVHQLLPRNPKAGMTAKIPALPVFDFTVIAGEQPPNGTYLVGLACTYFGATAQYWDTTIVVSDSGVKKGQLSWRLSSVSPNVFSADDSDSPAGTIAVTGGAVIVAGAVVVVLVRRRNRRRIPLRAKERR